MSTFLFELPTTGAISFSDFCVDQTGAYTTFISDATQARANLRTALKESKRTDGEKDYLKLVKVIDDYLPYLYAIIACRDAGEINLSSEPVFSWRSTLSGNLFNTSRISFPSLHADLAFTTLTYAFTMSNLARSTVHSLGNYEVERTISNAERKAKDEKLNFGVTLLCKATGMFQHISEKVLPDWQRDITVGSASASKRPPDVTQEVVTALSKMVLADAQVLAIRKLMSKSAYDSTLSPGPPLPKSHPSPTLIAKLYLDCAASYSSARSLAKTAEKSKGKESEDVSSELRHYLADESRFCDAVSKKWLGVDAGEFGGAHKCGEAIAFLAWAKEGLEDLKDGGRGVSLGKAKEKKERRKEKVIDELESTDVFLRNYRKVNDTLHFQPIPPTSELQSSIPAGRSAISLRPYSPPAPAFGPGSVEYERRKLDAFKLSDEDEDSASKASVASPAEAQPSYAGAGAYY